jgi:hypothetical protein
VVVEEEWPLLPQGRSSPRAQELSDDLRSAIQEFDPSTTTEQIIYTQELNAVNDLDEDRETRLLDARLRLPDILWVALVGLTICMLILSWLLGIEIVVVGHRGYSATHVGGLGFNGRHRSGTLHHLRTRATVWLSASGTTAAVCSSVLIPS